MPGLNRHLLMPVTAALSKSLKPLDLTTFESATRPSVASRNCSVTVPVSSLRSDDFGHSGRAQVLKSATAATRLGAGAFSTGAAGSAFCRSVVVGFVLEATATVLCCGGGC